MRVALYGGAFDPPHIGHALVAAAVLNSKLVEEVWFVPTGDRYDKKQVLPASLRLHMLTLFVEEEFDVCEQVKISDIEVRDDGIQTEGSTLELVRHLRSENPSYQFSFIIGSDRLSTLPSWRKAEELQREVPFLVVERQDFPLELPHGFQVTRVNTPFVTNISSSLVRALCAQGGATAGVLSPTVGKFISDQGLYRSATSRGTD